jgi:hypothetical protein
MKKGRRIIMGFLSITAAIILFLLFFPIKMAVKIENPPKGGTHYYICQQELTTGPSWCIIGDQSGFYGERIGKLVIIEGVDPGKILNKSVQIDSPNTFIIYGEITSEYYDPVLKESFPVITSKGFDIVYPIIRGYSFRVFVPKFYLTVLDYKLF